VAWPNPSYTRWLAGSQRCFVEDGLSLSVHPMAKRVHRTRGSSIAGSWIWRSGGEISSSVRYAVTVDNDRYARLELKYSINGEPIEQTITLVSEPCRFGGFRWFAYCPRTSQRVSKLYLPPGSRRFLSRQAFRIHYRSQSETFVDRATRRQRKLLHRLGADYADALPKPKGMHWRTYERLADEIERCENIWAVEAMRRFGIRL
jgi:hypothetical protein